MSFAAAEDNLPPPFYFLNSPWYDRPELDEKNEQKKTTSGKLKNVLGYAGQAKGIRHILWERGLWEDGMKAKLPSDDLEYPHTSAQDLLANFQDFREENRRTLFKAGES